MSLVRGLFNREVRSVTSAHTPIKGVTLGRETLSRLDYGAAGGNVLKVTPCFGAIFDA